MTGLVDDLEPGDQDNSSPVFFDAYRVVSKLGSGDFADVYKVADEAGNEFALKWASGGSGGPERLRNEIEVLKDLDHRGIPPYVDDGEKDGRPYVVMGLAAGETVKQLLESRAEAGGVHGQIEVLGFLAHLLSSLTHIHERGWVHRDIKSANVLATISMANSSVIDFGFAKRAGSEETRVDDSFWRAGAALYSPPEKLGRPGRAVPSHDVFAAGVLGYQLLTGDFPWRTEAGQDVGVLLEQMRSTDPPRVSELNSFVDPGVSRLVMELICIRDEDRPSAEAALARVKGMTATLAAREPTASRQGPIVYSHVIRDPLFGDVRLTDYEHQLLDTREMQRLRYFKQLGLTNLIYPGAEHTRLAHAIGCVYRTEQLLRSIEDIKGVRIDRDTRLIARIYALIHDVTHVAFGHTVEDELGIFERHDRNAKRIERLVLAPASDLGELLSASHEGREARAHFDPEASIQTRSTINELVSGSTGADVLDYIDRDAFHCGVDHRIDSAIFRQLRLQASQSGQGERLVSLLYSHEGLRFDREYAVESLLTERYALFLKVYCHRRKLAASALLDKALSTALFGGSKNAAPQFEEREYESLPDDVVIERLRASNRKPARNSAERLLRRELPRGVYRAQLLEDGQRTDNAYDDRRYSLKKEGLFDPAERLARGRSLARTAGVDPDDVFLYCPPKAPGYQRVSHWLQRGPGREEAADDIGSPLREIKARHLGLWELWVFCSNQEAGVAERLAAAAEDQFGLPNGIDVGSRPGRLF
jgi:HD superfamily phosphohydrolase